MLAEWGLGDLAETVELVVSELVTNAIIVSRNYERRGIPYVVLRLSAASCSALVEVWDIDPHPPVLKANGTALEENGRGLVLVDALCERWGWRPAPNGGKVVWANIKG